MKKITLSSIFCICLFALKASAQDTKVADSIATFSIADSSIFTGKYKYEGLPFDYMQISMKDNKLFYSGGEYSGYLNFIPNKKDAFNGNDNAVFTFVRNDDKKVITLKIDYQGQTYTGAKK